MPIRGKYKLVSDAGGSHAGSRPAAPVPPPGSAVPTSEEERTSSRKPRVLRRLLERSPFSATGQSNPSSGGGGGGGGGFGMTEPSTSPTAVISMTEVSPPPTRSPPSSTCLVDTSPPTTTAAAGATAARQTMSPPPPAASNPMEVIVEDEYSDPVDVRRRQSHEDIDADEEEATNAETRVYCEPYDSKFSHQGEQRKDRGSTVSRESEQLTPTNLVGGTSSAGGRQGCSRSNSMESPANTGMVPIMTGRLSSTGRSSNSSDSRTLSDSPAAFVRSPPGNHVGGSSCSSPCSPGARLVSSPPSSEHQARPKPFSGAARIPPAMAMSVGSGAPGSLYSSSPQGNNVISHHPSSPFEPVANAGGAPAAMSISSMAVSGPIPVSGGAPRRTSLHGPSPLTTENAAAAANSTTVVNAASQPPPPPMRSDSGPFATVLPPGQIDGGSESEVYEEAWDVRAARMGLDLSRVQETDIDFMPPAVVNLTSPVTSCASGTINAAALTTSPSSGHLSGTSTAPPLPPQPPPPPPNAASSAPGGGHSATVADSDTDYDYAYNRAWQLSQEMNRSLSLQPTSSGDSITAPGNVPSSTSTLPCPIPVGGHVGPMLEAQEVLDPDCVASVSGPSGSGSASSPVKTRSAQPDTDSLSTDSYDEPWDTRHRRMLEELTGGGSRFIDHPPSFMITSLTGASLSGAPPPPPHHPPPGIAPSSSQGNSATSAATTRRRSRNHSGPMRSEPVNPNSPLEEQPWYHSDITRAEAENLLKIHWEGSYLVRRSESNRQDFSLSIKHNKGYLHMKIVRNTRGEFILGQYSQPYSSIPAMIHHYSLSLLPIKGADHMTLQHPVSKHTCQQAEPLRITTA